MVSLEQLAGMSAAPSDVKLTLERTSSTLLQQIEVDVANATCVEPSNLYI